VPKSILLIPVALAAIALAAVVCAGAGASSKAATKTIGAVIAVDVRATLVATRTGTGSAPAATVTVELDRRTGSGWQRAVTRRLAGTYFWNSVTGPAAICRLDLATAGRGRTAPHLDVQLLVTPSIGCGKTQSVTLTR
jgi:hypothetical protein